MLNKIRKMKKRTICLFFNVHQPYRLKTYRFFHIGDDHLYFDDISNKNILARIAQNCYLPANHMMLDLIKKYGSLFKVTFGISGTALNQFKEYCPRVLQSFRQLYATGNIELVAESNANSLAMISYPNEYLRQVMEYKNDLEKDFGCHPTAIVDTHPALSDETAGIAYKLGFKTMLTGDSIQSIGLKNANYMYTSNIHPDLRILFRNYALSEDIALRYSSKNWSEGTLTPDKFISWLNALDANEEIVNLVIDYETLGEIQNYNSGIFTFLNSLIGKIIRSGKWNLKTISEAADSIDPVSKIDTQNVAITTGNDHKFSVWLGNDLQQEAYTNLYSVAGIMEHCENQALLGDWNKLQTCDHFYYMNTSHLNERNTNQVFSPYNSPYEAFVNYMNVLTDFLIRAKEYAARQADLVKHIHSNNYTLLETI